MSSEIISFNCKACHSGLTVPASLAGITGPCPICGAEITAPFPKAAEPEPAFVWPSPAEEQAAAAVPVARDLPRREPGDLPGRNFPRPARSDQPSIPAASPPPLEQPPWSRPPPGASSSPMEQGSSEKNTVAARDFLSANTALPGAASPWANSRGTQTAAGGFGNVAKLDQTFSSQEFEPPRSRGRDWWTKILPVALAFLVIALAYYFLIVPPARYAAAHAQDFQEKPEKTGQPSPVLPSEKTKPIEKTGEASAVGPEAGSANVSPLPPHEEVAPSDPIDISVPSPVPTAPSQASPPDPPANSFIPGAGASTALPPVPVGSGTAPAPAPLSAAIRVEVPAEAKPAVDVLVKFLEAPTWKERINYTSSSPKLKAAMEKYYEQNPDGSAKAKSVVFYGDRALPEDNQNLKIFIVETESIPGGIPVAVEKTKEGKFTVSWSSFAQFKDKVLDKFAAKPTPNRRGQFCATLKRSHYFGSGITKFKKDDLLTFRISTPIKNAPYYDVVMDRKSELGQQLSSVMQYNVELPVTVDLEWVTDDQAPYMKLASLPMPGWRDE